MQRNRWAAFWWYILRYQNCYSGKCQKAKEKTNKYPMNMFNAVLETLWGNCVAQYEFDIT